MTDLYLLKIPEEKQRAELFEKHKINLLPINVKEKILLTRDENTKRERMYAYGLLCETLIQSGISNKTLIDGFFFDEKGKPKINQSKLHCSVSRTDGIAAVAINKERPIGVDVEKIDVSKKEKIASLVSRFGFDSEKTVICENPKIILFTEKDGKIVKNSGLQFEKKSDENINFLRWTALESILKCDGRGFEAIKMISDISNDVHTESFLFSVDGHMYALSLSENKQTEK